VPNVTLAGRVQVRPPGEDTKDRLTVPVNPLTAVSVIVEVPEAPASIWAGDTAPAAIVKSRTVNVTVVTWVADPLVPVTVTVYVPAVPEHDRVEVWDAPRTMLEGLRVHVRPAGDTAEVRVTVPVNPLSGATVIVEVPVAPALTVTLVGLAEIAKSGAAPKVKVAVAVWTSEPLVPVIVTVKVLDAVEEQVSVAVPEPVTLDGVIAPQVSPAGTVSASETTPAKPFSAVTVIVEVAEEPAGTDAGDVAAIVKSRKVKVAVVE